MALTPAATLPTAIGPAAGGLPIPLLGCPSPPARGRVAARRTAIAGLEPHRREPAGQPFSKHRRARARADDTALVSHADLVDRDLGLRDGRSPQRVKSEGSFPLSSEAHACRMATRLRSVSVLRFAVVGRSDRSNSPTPFGLMDHPVTAQVDQCQTGANISDAIHGSGGRLEGQGSVP